MKKIIAYGLIALCVAAVAASHDGGGKIALAVFAFVYFIPALNAWRRRHHQTTAILLLNIFLGWTGIGWIAALVWSGTAPKYLDVNGFIRP